MILIAQNTMIIARDLPASFLHCQIIASDYAHYASQLRFSRRRLPQPSRAEAGRASQPPHAGQPEG